MPRRRPRKSTSGWRRLTASPGTSPSPATRRQYRCSCPYFRGWPGNRTGQRQQRRRECDHPARQTAKEYRPPPALRTSRSGQVMPGGGQLMASRATASQPVPAAGADHPLRRVRRRRGLTRSSWLTWRGCRRRSSRWWRPGSGHSGGGTTSTRWLPCCGCRRPRSRRARSPALTNGHQRRPPRPPRSRQLSDDIAVARHRELAGRFIGYVSRGDTYAAGAWLRRLARDPSVSPWLLLDQLTAPDTGLSGVCSRPSGGSGTRLVSAGSTERGRAG